MDSTRSATATTGRRIRIVGALVMATAVVLSAAAPVAADHGPASDQARCVGEFASTGATQLGAGFGVLISGRGMIPRPDDFGRTVVSIEARSDQGACFIEPHLFFPPAP
jgi:hypothetical protein